MLALNTLINQNSSKVIEQTLIQSLKSFAKQTGLSEYKSHQHLFWILQFIRFHNGLHPTSLNKADIESFLSSLATEKNYQQSIQTKAFNSMKYLYEEFLKIPIGECQYINNKKRRGYSDHIDPICCISVINSLNGATSLMAKLAYYCKIKLKEVVNLKVSDLDLKKNTISIRNNNGSIKYKANIPLAYILDLRIQKMRAHQISKRSNFRNLKKNRRLQNESVELTNQVKQFNLFSSRDDFLFPLQDHDMDNHSAAESQLSILKSELKLSLNQYFQSAQNTSVLSSRKKSIQSSFHFQQSSCPSIRHAVDAC